MPSRVRPFFAQPLARALPLLLALPLAAAMAGCDATPSSAPAESPVAIEYPEGGPPLNRHFGFVVDTGDAELVGVNADMPAHGHGINTVPEYRRLADGRWRVDGMLLHMPGAWELYFDLRRPDGEVERVVVPLQLDFE